ncbi:MAG: T9SS type A sorting domain-containing protein [candidate division Zixibacteria bacterium]|nr:T9SS type A sorting domain-containing protein [candidate division Zixibacteria bacterium]
MTQWTSSPYFLGIIICILSVQILIPSDIIQATEYSVAIQNSDPVATGEIADMPIYLSPSSQTDPLSFDRFELRVSYDRNLLSLWDVYSSQLETNCGWQLSFENTFLDLPDFPTGLLWIRAISIEGSLSSEDCFDPEDPLLAIQFLVHEEADLSEGKTPIDFAWYDCSDNRILNEESDTILVAAQVIDAEGFNITDNSTPLPTLSGLSSECTESGGHIDTVLAQRVNFRSATVTFKATTDISDSDDGPDILPRSLTLHQNYPNPFNPATTISFDLHRLVDWKIEIFNVLGSRVRTFVGRGGPGRESTVWNGSDHDGRPVGSGIYLYRLTAGNTVQSRKMLLVQ